ncbi:MAG: hypothetical protein R3C03_14220 [Pirellulaceae bacterium]
MSFFRRYQSTMMVVFGVTLMVIFLIGMIIPDPSMLFNQKGSEDGKRVVVKFKGGELTREQINREVIRHFSLQDFLTAVREYASQKKGEPVFGASLPLYDLPRPQSVSQSEIDQHVLNREIYAQIGKQEGILVSDSMAEDFIMMQTDDTILTVQELDSIARQVSDKRGEFRQFRDQLKKEILIAQAATMLASGTSFNRTFVSQRPIYSANPTEARQLFERTFGSVEAEVYPIRVADYVSKVTNEPTHSEINSIFEEGKFELPDPMGEKPGFKIGKMANIQYFVFDFNTILQNEINKLTDKEVQEEYDRLVAAKDPLVTKIRSSFESTDKLPGQDSETTEDSTDTEVKPEDATTQPPTTEGDGEKAEGENAEGSEAEKANAGDGEEKAESTSEGEGENGNSQESSESTENKEDGKTENSDDNTTLVALKSEHFVSAPLNQSEQEQEETNQEEGQSGDTSEPAEDAVAQQSEADQSDAPESQAGDEATQADAAVEAQEPQDNLEIMPLADVADAIKRRMKMQAAQEKIRNLSESAELEVRTYQNNWISAVQSGEIDEDDVPDFDGEEFAKKHNITFGETESTTITDFQETEFGKINVFMNQQVFPMANVVRFMFESSSEYEPVALADLTQKQYMVWLASQEDARIPKLEEVRDDVIAFWKNQKAFDAAQVDAQKIAEQVNAENVSLIEKFGESAKNTGEFTWFNPSLGFSEPADVEAPGAKFMEAAFGTELGKATSAPNATREVVYVIRITDRRNPGSGDLNEEFLKRVSSFQMFPFELQTPMEIYSRDLIIDQRLQLEKEMDVRWME